MKRELITIGAKTTIDFPQAGVFSVPAKVDTGADSSSVWATGIRQTEDGELQFMLFAPSSPYYTGEVLTSSDYKIISVKNSFGQAEYRYKVKLQVKISGKVINGYFTLADRAKNSRPVLIGRRMLSGKFLVDVSQKSKPRVKRLLLLSTKITDPVGEFARGVEGYSSNMEITHASYDDLLFTFHKNRSRIIYRATNEDISSFDIVHLKTSVIRDVTASVARYMLAYGRQVIDAEGIKTFPESSKLYQYTLLVPNGITVPKSVFVMPKVYTEDGIYEALVDQLGLPFVLKDIHNSRGNNNEVIRNKPAYEKMTNQANRDGVYLVAQSFIPNDGDYRLLAMGQKIELAIWRRRKDDTTHLNNTSQGGLAELHDVTTIPSKVLMDSLKALRILGRDIGGVDMVRSTETGTWYCFEVNDGPQIATGAFLEEKRKAYAAFIKRKLENKT